MRAGCPDPVRHQVPWSSMSQSAAMRAGCPDKIKSTLHLTPTCLNPRLCGQVVRTWYDIFNELGDVSIRGYAGRLSGQDCKMKAWHFTGLNPRLCGQVVRTGGDGWWSYLEEVSIRGYAGRLSGQVTTLDDVRLAGLNPRLCGQVVRTWCHQPSVP